MILHLKQTKLSLRKCLEVGGYTYRKDKNDFIREDHADGRFHVMMVDRQPMLHFDIYVEWRHVSFNLPEHMRKERNRINKLVQMYNKEKRDEKNIPSTSEA